MATRERAASSDEGDEGSPNGAADFLPASRTLAAARKAAAGCRGCGLYRHATQALFGKRFSVTRERGRLLESPLAPLVVATLHPSALLRIREADERREAFERFVADLKLVRTAEPIRA